MSIPNALAALRTLDLTTGRKQYLGALIVEADSDADRAEIIRSATAEAVRVAKERGVLARADIAQRAAYAAREAERPAEKPSEPSYVWHPREDAQPAIRPVTDTWTTPRNPDAVREPNRPEQSDGFERTRAQREKRAKHGTTGGYAGGCRCQPCRDAMSAYKRAYVARKRAEREQRNQTDERERSREA